MSALPFAAQTLILVLMVGLLAWWLCRQFINPDSKLHLLDHPNERSLHTTPVPRSGGIAVLIAVAAGLIAVPFSFSLHLWWLVGGAALIAAVSMADDWFDLPVVFRFTVHLLAAAMIVYGMDAKVFIFLPQWLDLMLLVVATVWMVNLYNFMDGMDGFAGGMGLIGFGCLAVAGLLHGVYDFALLALLVAAGNAGFLLHNFPPARIFMGDAGSATMGFLAAGFTLWGIREEVFALWFPLLVFSPFILDATVTLLRRALRGEKVWQAHRQHYYQRLTLAGWGHKKTVLSEYILMIAVAISSLIMLHHNGAVYGGLFIWGLLYMLLAYKADRFCQKK